MDHLALPLQFLDDFVQPKKSSFMAAAGGGGDVEDGGNSAATVLDVCSGRTDHVNLKQAVSDLELPNRMEISWRLTFADG